MKKNEKKHTKDSPIKNVFSCDGCGFKTNVRSRIMRHTKSCLRFIARKEFWIDEDCKETRYFFENVQRSDERFQQIKSSNSD